MAQNTIYQSNILELVFAARKKEYGAYTLRKTYDKHMVIAMFVSIAFFTSGITIPLLINHLAPKVEEAFRKGNTDRIVIGDVPLINPKTKPQIMTENVETIRAKIKFLPPVITSDAKAAAEYIPTKEELKYIDAGNKTIKGNPDAFEDIGKLIADVVPPETPPVENVKEAAKVVHTIVEFMPEFIGGEEALFSYLYTNIRYPEIAKKAGIEGRVMVQFIINKSGEVSNVEIAKGIGGGCDEEAVRVIKNMPSWKPGKQNGLAVNVRMVIPIAFKLK